MTQPSVIYFGADSGSTSPGAKVYLRTLLFCTAKRGRVIETMYVALRRNETRQNFSVWVNGDDRLARGSGLFVSENGVVANHHFLPPPEDNSFAFREGSYQIEVFAKLIDKKESQKLFEHELFVNPRDAKALEDSSMGLYFDWAPEIARYIPHLKRKPQETTPQEILERLSFRHELFKTTHGERVEPDSVRGENL